MLMTSDTRGGPAGGDLGLADLLASRPGSLRHDLILAVGLGLAGVLASYASINIPHSEIFIDGRTAFAFMAFALLHRVWLAGLVACAVSLAGVHEVSLLTAFLGNMSFFLPILVVIRLVHGRVLMRWHSLTAYALGWAGLVLACYQVLAMPLIGVGQAIVRDAPVMDTVAKIMVHQDLLVASILVAIVSGAGMVVTRALRTLARQQHELDVTLRSIGDGVVATDVEGRITRMNPTAETLTGWQEAEALGHPFAEVVRLTNALTKEPAVDPVARVLAEGRVVGLANSTTLTAREGQRRQIADSAAPIREVDGSLMGVVMVFRDVSDAYATHAELEQSKRQLDLAIRSAELGIWDWDTATDRVSLAGRQSDLFGFGVDQTVVPLGAFQARVHPDDWQPVMAEVTEAMEMGSGFDCDFRVILPDGGLRWVRSIGSQVTDTATGTQHVIGTARDVTDRKRSEDEARRTMDALIRSNAELERFAYVASHDLQEPIRSIVAYSQLLGQRHGDRLDGEAREFLEFIIDGGKRMQALVLDLLEYSRVATRGRAFAPVDLQAVIRAARENLRLSIADSGATLTVQEPLPSVLGDETQLVSLMQNLIGNAIKFHRPGVPPAVVIDGAREDNAAVITVSDNGIGIAAEHHDKVFQIFKRLHGSEEFPGTGVGLALTKRIVEHHGGTIALDSRPDEGSRFSIRLPLSPEPANDTASV